MVKFKNPIPEPTTFEFKSSDQAIMRVIKSQITLAENETTEIQVVFSEAKGRVFLMIADLENQISEAHLFIVR